MNTFFTPKTSKMKWLLSCVIVLSFLVSCADETMLNSTDVKQTTEKNIGETSRIGISGNACVELADVSSSLDGNTTTTRAVSVNLPDFVKESVAQIQILCTFQAG